MLFLNFTYAVTTGHNSSALLSLCGCVAKYLFRREMCSAGTYFTDNLFFRNFLNEKLVPGTYLIGKFIPPM
jgi:hypothetical protein